MFLVRRIPAWHRNELKRLVKAPKLQFLDSGLLAALKRVGPKKFAKDRQRLGPLLESFVYWELAKAVSLTGETTTVRHYRDKDQVEVDLVLERSPEEIVGIEVESRATESLEDCRGLKRLEKAAGDHFVCGILLHDGERVQKIAPKLFAIPDEMP